jgi:uncharacterized OB-fold protein
VNADHAKPLPRITPVTAPFWEGAAENRLVMQRCTGCRAFVWTPRPHCYECGSTDLIWTELSGRGEVYSFAVIRQLAGRGTSAAFQEDIPYIIAFIDLAEGPRIFSNLVHCAIEEAAIAMKVQVVFEQASLEIWLPKFSPADA